MKNKSFKRTVAAVTAGIILILPGFTGCQKDKNQSLPVLTTSQITNITETTAVSGGEITDDGGSDIIFRGVCWSSNDKPTVYGTNTRNGSGKGSFSSLMTGLRPGQPYNVRAYATNNNGTGYGPQLSFTTAERVTDTSWFPIGVWLQSPSNASAYKENGINIYVGLWNELDLSQLNFLRNAGIKVICKQNAFGLSNKSDTLIYGWMHGDEPDNAQWNEALQKYDPCIDPAIIIADYTTIKTNDPSRPVYLNLGQGVAYTNYVGRGACRNNTDMYKISNNGYLAGCDIGSFDIYPVNNTDIETSGNLWYVAKGIDNLLTWSDHTIPVWCWIECTQIRETSAGKPTPAQVKTEVWMALVHGAKGFGYFCHSWYPTFDEAALLHDAEMIQAVKDINDQVASLASVLNSQDISGYASVSTSNTFVPVDFMVKNYGGAYYIFAVAMRDGNTTATFSVTSGSLVEVIGEGRAITINGGSFSDNFTGYGVHLYKVNL